MVNNVNENLYSIQIEESVLSALMSLNAGIDDIISDLSEDSFYAVQHKIIFKHIKKLFDIGMGHDLIMVFDSIKLDANDSKIVDEQFLINLNATTGLAHLLDKHVLQLNEHSRRRSLFNASERIKSISIDTTQYTTDEAVAQSESVLANLDSNSKSNTSASAHELVVDLFGKINQRIEDRKNGCEKLDGIKTGFRDIDNKVGMFRRGELIIIAARPSMGKTVFIQDIMLDISFFQGHPVLFQSAEMPKESIGSRILSSLAEIKTTDIRNATIPDDKWKSYSEAVTRLEKSKLVIDDQPSPTISHIRKNCRRMKAQYGYVGAVFIDYLTLLTPPLKTDQNYLAVGSISKALSALAKEFDCPVFCLSQLSRKVEDRADKRPMMSDLRESGQIEQDANTILFIYRDEVYNKASKDVGIAEIIAAKVRDGETGTVRLFSELQYSRFCDLDINYLHSMEDSK